MGGVVDLPAFCGPFFGERLMAGLPSGDEYMGR
jgi:hypothetical protein